MIDRTANRTLAPVLWGEGRERRMRAARHPDPNRISERRGVLSYAVKTPLFFVLLVLGSVSSALALDSIRTAKGTTLNGTIQQMSAREVVFKLANGSSQTLSVSEIDAIKFGGEPPQLNIARTAALGGRYEEAVRNLDKVVQDGKGLDRAEVQQDVSYLQAYCAAKLALEGGGDVLAAGKQMREFVQKNPNNYRFITANELLGDLLTVIEKHDLAQQHYATVERLAPTSDIKMRARIAQGNALLAQGKTAEALSAFDGALTLTGEEKGPQIDQQRHLANLGKAVCLAADQPDEGIKLVEAIIAEADPQQSELFAKAYNALGTCQRKAGRDKDALLAFLHVDVLFSGSPMTHAEALKNLSELWSAVGNPQRAVEAQEILKTRYANTRWAKG